MGKLNKADIFKIKPVHQIEKVKDVPGYPGIVFGVRVMSAGEHEDYENLLYDLEEKEDKDGKPTLKAVPLRKDTRIKLLIYTVCDPESGDLLFDLDDVSELRKMSTGAIKKLFDAAKKLNDIDAKEEDTKQMGKNS